MWCLLATLSPARALVEVRPGARAVPRPAPAAHRAPAAGPQRGDMLSFDALAGVASAAAADGAPAFEGLDGAALLSEREHTSKLRRGSRAANATWQWQPVEYRGNPPTRREGHTAVAVENYLIIFGGCFLDRECFGDVKVRRGAPGCRRRRRRTAASSG